jgi:TRAP-type C4-dicarboxylate transport system permease small subunit
MTEMPGQQKGNAFSRFVERLDPWILGVAACFLIVSGCFFLYDMFYRLVFNESHDWTTELAIASIVWAVFLGSGPAYKRGQHIAMSIFSDLMGKDRFRPIEFALHGLMIVFCFLMTWKGAVLAMKSIAMGNSTSALDPFPVGYFKLCIPIGMGFFTFYALSEALRLDSFPWGRKARTFRLKKI